MLKALWMMLHGGVQIGTPWADGTASISQCPINPGETFNYEFKADKVVTNGSFSRAKLDGNGFLFSISSQGL
jgi:hypothetical protein